MNEILVLGMMMALCALWGWIQIRHARTSEGEESEGLCSTCELDCDR